MAKYLDFEGLTKYDTKLKEYIGDGSSPFHKAEKTLLASAWNDNTLTLTVDGINAGSYISYKPTPASRKDFIEAEIFAVSQGTDSIAFECENEPTNDIDISLVFTTGNGIELVFDMDTPTDIGIGLAGASGVGEFTEYGKPYNWNIYLDGIFVKTVSGVTAATKVETISNSKTGIRKVTLISKLKNQDYCAESIGFYAFIFSGSNYLGSYDKLISAKGLGTGFTGTAPLHNYAYHLMFAYCSKLQNVLCQYPNNFTSLQAFNWLYNAGSAVVSPSNKGKLYSPNAVITYGLPANWTAEAL